MTTIEYNRRHYTLTFQEYHPPLWLSFWANQRFYENYRKISGTDAGFIYAIKNNEFTGFMRADGGKAVYDSIAKKLSKERNNRIGVAACRAGKGYQR